MTAESSPATNDARRLTLTGLCIWAGIVGPIVFFAVFTVDGALTPGYSAWSEPVSYLALGPAGWIQTANFIVLGVLLAAFAFAFFRRMRAVGGGAWLVTISILLVVSGLGYLLAGIFTSAPPGEPQNPMHTVAFSTVFLPLGIAGVAAGVQLVRAVGWRAVGSYSILAGLVVLAAALGNLSSFLAPTPQTPISSPASQQVLGGLGGLANRVVVALALAWYVMLAVRMLRRSERGS